MDAIETILNTFIFDDQVGRTVVMQMQAQLTM